MSKAIGILAPIARRHHGGQIGPVEESKKYKEDLAAAVNYPIGSQYHERIIRLLLVITLVYLVEFGIRFVIELIHLKGVMINPVTPLGRDFINMWVVAKLVLAEGVQTIYQPDAFMAFQREFTHSDIGFRLWVYPPTSLLFAWPVGLFGYVSGFVVWSLFGLAFLAFCSRRFGFSWQETAILVLSPASMACIEDGQTGNIFTGLLLIAVAPRSPRDLRPVLATALLTLKAQMGFLLPVLWLRQQRWALIFLTAAACAGLAALSLPVFGVGPWSDYFGRVQPLFAHYLQNGSGPYMLMYPSVFMAMRNLGFPGDTAIAIHAVFAVAAAALLLWRLWNTNHPATQTALLLVGTCLVTPYLHTYDLTMLLAAGLLILRNEPERSGLRFNLAAGACIVTWFAPIATHFSAMAALPVMPLVLLGVFLVIREPGFQKNDGTTHVQEAQPAVGKISC